MKILDVLNSPWAIVPDKLAEITEIYGRHLRGEKIDVAALEAKLGRPLASQPKSYSIVADGVAVLPVEGVLAKRMNLMMDISGGTSLQYLSRDISKALADPAVKSIILAIDSPGGTVDGTLDAARVVAAARAGDKPIVTWVDGNMMSGAYWIGSAADQVFIGAATDQIGSIGVATQHVDYSGMDAKEGIKRTDIYAGKYKRITSSAAPLSPEGRTVMQDQIDYIYSLFVEAVAAHRGVSVEQVLSDMADGRIFTGRQAIDAGLVDGVATLDAVVAELAAGTYQRKRMKPAGAAGLPLHARPASADANVAGAATAVEPTEKQSEGEPMNLKELREKHPELVAVLIDEGRAIGASAELARILAVEAQAMPGHEELVAQLKADGKTTGPEAAVQILAAEKAKTAGRLTALRAEAPKPAPAAPSADGEHAAAEAADAALPIEERAKKQFDADPKLSAEFGTVERYTGWLKHEASRKAA